jgi:ribosomal protein S18 acetylase RimI-like enzyme
MVSQNDKNQSSLTPEIRISRGNLCNVDELQNLAVRTFKESHGHSAAPIDIQEYIDNRFTLANIKTELLDAANLFHLIYCGEQLIGYSKIILNTDYEKKTPNNSCKLERLYVLKKFHGTEVGKLLMDFNIQLAKENQQSGIWLYVWTENRRAIHFYEKYGFVQIAETVFQISINHGNPNFILHLMF